MDKSKYTVNEYLEALPNERKHAMGMLRNVILENLPAGFEETISYGMLSYVVPHSIYPSGYHVDPKQPLPFISIASQKNFISFYHMGLYANRELLDWFIEEFRQQVKSKLDMGKSCIRFKKTEQIPYSLLKELLAKISVAEWISTYEAGIRK